MANFHSVSFAVAGPRQAVNQAILLVALKHRRSPLTREKVEDSY